MKNTGILVLGIILGVGSLWFVEDQKKTFEVVCSDRGSDLNNKLKEINPKEVSAPAIHAHPIVCVTIERRLLKIIN